MTMTDETVLDGNAAAGVLDAVFRVEATTTIVTCASCGASGPIGAAVVYVTDMGTVVRCVQCSAVLIRCAEIRDRVIADMRGAATISFAVPGTTGP
jgi:ribosomal protein S27E